MTRNHSKTYIKKYRNALVKTYGYETYMDFIVIPSLLSKPVLSYLPLINYTDRNIDETADLLELSKESNYLIRVLNPHYSDFKPGDTVTMRIPISSRKSEDLMQILKSRCRTKVRNASKRFHYTLKSGREQIDDFYSILSSTYHRHGTPIMPKELLYNIQDEFGDTMYFFVAYDENDIPAAALSTCIDGTLACCPWGGLKQEYNKMFAGYYIYFEVMKTISQKHNIEVFDFGRSPFDGPTFKFKSQFGAQPIKIDLLKPKDDDIYNKYHLASEIWKRLPRFTVDLIGPKLSKYLADL